MFINCIFRLVLVHSGRLAATMKTDITASRLCSRSFELWTVVSSQKRLRTPSSSASSMWFPAHPLQGSTSHFIGSLKGKATSYKTNVSLHTYLSIYNYVFIYYLFSITCDFLYLAIRTLNLSAFNLNQMETTYLLRYLII